MGRGAKPVVARWGKESGRRAVWVGPARGDGAAGGSRRDAAAQPDPLVPEEYGGSTRTYVASRGGSRVFRSPAAGALHAVVADEEFSRSRSESFSSDDSTFERVAESEKEEAPAETAPPEKSPSASRIYKNKKIAIFNSIKIIMHHFQISNIVFI